MVQNSKVLTVSYGTFSCTLEGFEDSFGTMKAIAEYFRDLASDDRYFGAEPPQPDADMLARIAQREIARQVEARTSEAGIHLRAAETAVPAVAPAPSEEPAPTGQASREEQTGEDQTAATPEKPTEDVLPEEVPARDTDLQEDETDAGPEAAQVQDAEDQESTEPSQSSPEPEVAAALHTPPEPDASKIAAISAVVAANAAQTSAEPQSEAKDEPEEADTIAATDIATNESQGAAGSTAKEQSAASAESITAKLRRIRAVVSKSSEEDYSEDEHAENILPDISADISEVLSATQTKESASEAPAEELLTQDDADENRDKITRVLSQLSTEGDIGIQNPSETATTEDTSGEDTGSDSAAKGEADLKPDEVEAQEVGAPAPAPRRPRARVIKVKRADLAEAGSDSIREAAKEETQISPSAESSLSDEDEEDLMRELAAVEAELLAASDENSQDEDVGVGAPAATQEQAPDSNAPARQAPNVAESDVSRLMDAADAKLGAPESASSRETYNHLRAAVAAAKADPATGGTAGSADSEGAYREDLADVVKPRRPASGGVQPLRKSRSGPRPAPLKLVAEQRIDPDQASSAPKESPAIRPRRISVLNDAGHEKASADGGFAAYAQDCGAVELPDLLEAAAAYLSFVEGRDHFSRPQLLNAVRKSGTAEFKREDGLRSFGQLLRDGKIERSENGRFVATEDIGFQPATRAAG